MLLKVVMDTRKSGRKANREAGKGMAMKAVNVAGKARKNNNPYATWVDPYSGWVYRLLRSSQADNAKPYARWFVEVEGFGHDMGDEYVSNMAPGVLAAGDDLTFDKTVWASREDFEKWVVGSGR